ncbi:MAG TPA: exodeoxyribonuclease V subunit gamma [Thermoanaerobaculia bacterium]|nr:exodeoxyribonuclease V subunit gamma [Thermoanaerobaculia bacterium]
MIHLAYSNRTERLLATLVERLEERRARGAHPLAPVELVVPNRNLEAYVRFGVAEALGIAANLRFRRLERLLGELAQAAGHQLLDGAALQGMLLAILLDEEALRAPELSPVRDYLEVADGRGRELRRAQLSARLAHLFAEYGYSRPGLLAAWRDGRGGTDVHDRDLEAWQRALWLRVFGSGGLCERIPPKRGRWLTPHELPASLPRQALPPTLHVFGLSYVAWVFHQLFARLGQEGELYLYTLNPCREFWEDVETGGEHRHRLRRQRPASVTPADPADDPFGLFADTESFPLRRWGRPGRENIRLLNDLTDCDFDDRFAQPAAEDRLLLHRLQRDVLNRVASGPRQRSADPWLDADDSLQVLACPSSAREVEVVADAIWGLLRSPAGRDLRFSDIAVIFNHGARDLYLPQIEAVFRDTHAIPHSVGDLPLAGESRVVEAAKLLLELPFGSLTRPDLLRFMVHPAVTGGDPTGAGAWVELADRLGILFGADRQDLAGTYAAEEDLLSWDQGIKRLALGAFMTGEPSGDSRLVTLAGQQYLPAEPGAVELGGAARFGLLARSLLADARALREERRTLEQWTAFFRRQLLAYLRPPAGEEAALGRCLAAFEELSRLDIAATPVGGTLAASLAAEALAGLVGGRGAYLAEGVVISSFLPMRAIPFQVVFVLGLGEGLFPAANRRDALDLRADRRLPGDVPPAERDRYMFLETLLSARRRLVLSYPSRDQQTGEPLRPSSVVQELLSLLDHSYLGPGRGGAVVRELPLRRHDARYFPADPEATPELATVAPGAADEASARTLGDSLRRALGRGGLEPHGWQELRRGLPAGEWRELRRVLALAPLPLDQAPADHGERRGLPARALRELLENPLQAWAATVVGLARDEDEDLLERDEEPLATPRLTEALLLREALFMALQPDGDPAAAYRSRARRLALAGRMPVGVLARIEEERHLALLQGARDALEEALAGTAGRGELVRFGRAGEHEAVSAVLPGLLLDDPGPGPALVAGRELFGRSQLLLADRRVVVVLDPRPPVRGDKCRPWRLALRGYLDHLLLSATGDAEVPRETLVLNASADGAEVTRVPLAPLAADGARRRLCALAADLLAGPHDYALPCEAVFAAWEDAGRRWQRVTDEALREQVERYRDGELEGSGGFGPVPLPRRYPAPARPLELADRRFAPFFSLVEG